MNMLHIINKLISPQFNRSVEFTENIQIYRYGKQRQKIFLQVILILVQINILMAAYFLSLSLQHVNQTPNSSRTRKLSVREKVNLYHKCLSHVRKLATEVKSVLRWRLQVQGYIIIIKLSSIDTIWYLYLYLC